MTDRSKPTPAHLARNFAMFSKTEKLPPTDGGLNMSHLLYAQKYNRALILEGLNAAEKFEANKEYSVVLLQVEGQAIGAEAVKVYGKAAGNLTPEELALVNYPGTLSDFLKETGYHADTPVSYAILDPKRHCLLSMDGEGNLTVDMTNRGFQLKLH